MDREANFVWFACLGFLLLVISQLIRTRLKKYHPDLFAKLRSPTFQDSNLGRTYWSFQQFVWWGHTSEVNDAVVHGLCVFAVLIEVAVLIFFFLAV